MAKIKKILITGSTGKLGSDFYQLVSGDYEVIGLSRHQHPRTKFCADIIDHSRIQEIIRQTKPDIIIHTAALSKVDSCELNPELAWQVNVKGTENLVLSSKEIDAVFVYISTDYVFSGRQKAPYKEEDAIGPVNIYAQTKLKGEEVIKSQLSKFIIIRTSWLFGKNGWDFTDTVLELARANHSIAIVNDKFSIPTYTVDLSRAILNLIRLGDSWGTFHIANGLGCSWFDYAKKIIELTKLDTEVLPMKLEELNLPAKRPPMTVLDISKFQRLSGQNMRPWQEALSQYLCSKN